MSKGHLSNAQTQKRLRSLEKDRRIRLEEDIKAVTSMPGGEGGRVLLWVAYTLCDREGGAMLRGDDLVHQAGRRYVSDLLLAEVNRVVPGSLSTAISHEYQARADEQRFRAASMTETAEEAAQEPDHG